MQQDFINALKNAIVNTQQTGNIVPKVAPFGQDVPGAGYLNLPQQAGNTVANMPGNIINSIYGQGIVAPTEDVAQLASGQLPNYNDLRSGPAKLAYNVMFPSTRQPTELVGNTAQAVLPAAEAYGISQAGANIAGAEPASNPIQAFTQGAKAGYGPGAVWGGLQALSGNRHYPPEYAQKTGLANDPSLSTNELLNQAVHGGAGAIEGGAVGGWLGGLGGILNYAGGASDVGRPAHQAALEQALNKSDYVTAQKIVDTIPNGDPYKIPMQHIVDLVTNTVQNKIGGNPGALSAILHMGGQ